MSTFWKFILKKISVDTLPHTFKLLQSEVWKHFPHTHTHSTTLQFSYIYKKIMKSCLQMYFIFFPHMNDFGKKSPRRLRHPPAQSSVKQLRHYYSLSCPWWKQCHSYASVGNKGVHSSRVIQLFVSWLSLQTQKAGDELMFTKTAET